MKHMETMIEAQGLTKFYGQKRAISNVTFTVDRGEILGFLGPNGAGKTTTMKILTCFISPSAGTAKVNGHDVFEASLQARQNTGYLPENAPLYKEMTVLEDLRFFAEMRGVPAEKRTKAIGRVIDVCGLREVVGHEIRELSKGFRQRVGLAQAMVHNPDILILDEPTSGLDPNQIAEIRGLIKELGKEKTIILSTHNLAEVQATCSRVIIINKGKIVADGTVDELAHQQRGRLHTVVTRKQSVDGVRKAIQALRDVSTVETGQTFGDDEVELRIFPKGDIDLRASIAKAVVEGGAPLLELRHQEASLEDVFRGLTLGDAKKGKGERRKAGKRIEEPEEPEESDETEEPEEPDEPEEPEESEESEESDEPEDSQESDVEKKED